MCIGSSSCAAAESRVPVDASFPAVPPPPPPPHHYHHTCWPGFTWPGLALSCRGEPCDFIHGHGRSWPGDLNSRVRHCQKRPSFAHWGGTAGTWLDDGGGIGRLSGELVGNVTVGKCGTVLYVCMVQNWCASLKRDREGSVALCCMHGGTLDGEGDIDKPVC